MGADIRKPVVIAAIIILLLLALLVRARALFSRDTSRRGAPPHRRRLNLSVGLVPLPGFHFQQANHGGEHTNDQVHHPAAHHHLRQVDSVTSLRNPPPAYHARHLDRLYDGVAYGYGNTGHAGGITIDVVPHPPSYSHLPL